MAIKGDLVGKYITGCDVAIPECGIFISQPSVKTILQFGEDGFFSAVNFFSQLSNMLEEIKKESPEAHILSELHLLIMVLHEEPLMKIQLENFFEIVFSQYHINVTESSLDFLQTENDKQVIKGRVTPFNFAALRQVITDLFLPYTGKKEAYNPKSSKAAAIAEKLKKGREKIAAQKGEQDTSLFGSYLSILAIGMNLDLNVLLEYTPFQLYDLFMRYNRKIATDRYFDISTVPFADTSDLDAPDEWTGNLYS